MADDLVGTLADGPLASEGFSFTVATALDDALTLGEIWSYQVIPGGLASDKLTISESYALSLMRNASMIEAFKLQPVFRLASLVALVESITTSDSFVALVNHVLGSAFTVQDVFSPAFVYGLSVVERVRLYSLLDALNHIDFSDTLSVTDAGDYAFIAGSQLVETISFQVDLSYNLVLRLAFSDRLALDDEELLNFVYSVGIEEGIIAEIVTAPGGSITTWAINTRTNAVTEYRNWSFNSFASIGRKYIAADENGLYELNGARDGAENVMALIAGGYFQPNGAKLAGLKGVYLGVGGQGKSSTPLWVLKLVTGDGREYVYQRASNPNLMTTKFDIGKGLRARYIAWELVNQDGQDFDLDSIEFVPMMSGRRVG